MNIVLIGSGNLARALAVSVPLSGCFARNPQRAAEIACLAGCSAVSDYDKIPAADLYLVAVSDDAIGAVTRQLVGRIPAAAVVAHTSGSVPITDIDSGICNRGVFYPLYPFGGDAPVDFSRVDVFLEFSGSAQDVLEQLTQQLSCRTHFASSPQRKKIHISAVFSCNFVNYLFSLSQRILRDVGCDFSVQRALILRMVENALQEGVDIAALQTGPAARGDCRVLDEHLKVLSEDKELSDVYRLLTEKIMGHTGCSSTQE